MGFIPDLQDLNTETIPLRASVHDEFGSYRIEEYDRMKQRIADLEESNRQLAALVAELNEDAGYLEKDLLRI